MGHSREIFGGRTYQLGAGNCVSRFFLSWVIKFSLWHLMVNGHWVMGLENKFGGTHTNQPLLVFVPCLSRLNITAFITEDYLQLYCKFD